MSWTRDLPALALLVFLESPFGGAAGSIRGCVTDAGGAPASDALIHIDGADFMEVRTDSQGCFDYYPGAGAFTVWAETKAGTSEPRDVKVKSAGRSSVQVDLQIKPARKREQPPLMNLQTLRTKEPEPPPAIAAPLETPGAPPNFDTRTATIPNTITFDPPVVSDQGEVLVTVRISRPGVGALSLWTSHPWVAALPASVPLALGSSNTVTLTVPVKRVRGPSDIIVFFRANDGRLTYSGALTVRSVSRVTVTIAGSGAGMVLSSPPGVACGIDCSAPFADDTYVKLTAKPLPGSVFAGWSGDCTPQGVVRISGPMTCIATFDR